MLLLRKATSDLNAARTLAADPRQTDDVVGFHVQQAIEKAIKSSLATHVVEVPRTHDLSYLVERATGLGIPVPLGLDEAEHLTSWAVAMRYEDIVSGLDRDAVLAIAGTVVAWARTAGGG